MPYIHFGHVADGPQKGFYLVSMSGREAISELFNYTLVLESDRDTEIEANDIIGQEISLRMDYFELENQDNSRYLHGIVKSFKVVNSTDTLNVHRYVVELVPALWYLTKSTHFRVFADQKSSDIITSVLSDHNINANIASGKIQREHCIQYLETDFEFISRLIADEGLIFYFEHSKDNHQLKIADSKQYISGGKLDATSAVLEWNPMYKLVAGNWEVGDYSYTTTKALAEKKKSTIRGLDNSKLTRIVTAADIGGEGVTQSVKNKLDIVTEREDAEYEMIEASSGFLGVCAGASFKLDTDEVWAKGCANELVVIEAELHMNSSSLYENKFICIPADIGFRGKERPPRPIVHGPMTAVVVESGGDDLGRVKVKFLYEGTGCSDSDSCWIRVAQVIGGNGYGAMFTPRIDEEVVVSFINGNPDRPLITGTLYNSANKPSKDYVGEKGKPTRNGIRTTFDGKKFNEMYFEDKPGEELFHISTDNNYERLVEANDTLTINKGERKITIKEGDENQTLEKGNQTVTLKDGNQTVKLDNGDILLESSAKNIKMKAGQNMEVKADSNIELTAASNITLKANSKIEIKVGGNSMTMDSMGITLKVGGNSVKIEQSGVTVKGVTVSVEGNAQAQLKAPMTTVSGDGMLTVKGGIVMIN